MPAQDLRTAPAQQRQVADTSGGWRLAMFLPAISVTILLLWGLHSVFAASGMSWLEWLLLSLIGMTFVWVTFAVSTTAIGLASALDRERPVRKAEPLSVALLMPIYNETPKHVFGNAAAMLDDLTKCAGDHHYTLFVLSDTQDPLIAAEEEAAFAALRARSTHSIFYRRRRENTDKKTGNIADWVRGWGAGWDAMIVLDADSLMSGRALRSLADQMAADPEAGLIQSFPQLIGAETLFARLQQFSNLAYGRLLAEGLARWSQSEGNYWGHNAIIRTRAFAEAAGLPRLRGRLILSHDFVEASLLRRAGWGVRFVPRVPGSFEETPNTLIDYVIRDRRWCRGNLQHLRLLGTRGLHGISRFHLFQGAAAYLMSPAWLMLLVFWALLGVDAQTNVIAYFSEENPLFPSWPPAMTHINNAMFLLIMYAMLLAPKLASAALIVGRRGMLRRFGGIGAFSIALVTEIILAIAYAPILMIQQCRAVLRALFARPETWHPQRRDVKAYSLKTLIIFHWAETVLGAALSVGIGAGLISLWLLPIAASLTLAVPLSALSAVNLAKRAPRLLRLNSPLTLHEPPIVTRARDERQSLVA